ncbi:MAG: serine/threonine protein kinase [Planctomycetota bacterium]|nr:MAG: serine/threonine protein kinase [Planctomycetota bacterium]
MLTANRAIWLLAAALFVAGPIGTTVTAADTAPPKFSDADWPGWRGPRHDGHANPNQQPPTEWSRGKNVVWRTEIPGRGHSSPTALGDRIFLATADEMEQIQSVLCYDRATGKRLWKTDVHRGGFEFKNKKASLASSTVATDGQRLFINFPNSGALTTTALSLNGEQLWQTKITDYEEHQGYGSSPMLYDALVLVSADNKAGGAIAGLNRETGDIVWRHERPKKPNYASPIVVRAAGRDQVVMTGCDLVSGFDPASGKKLWEVDGATTECVTSTVSDGKLIFTSGGYPENHVCAVRADGSGEIAWKNNTRVYVPSMLLKDGYLYAVTDAGVAVCWEAATGKEQWKSRLGGTFSSSPVLVGESIYAVNEGGKAFVYRADPSEFESIATSQLGDEVFATPTICGGRIYLRVAENTDRGRQELLYCLGSSPENAAAK